MDRYLDPHQARTRAQTPYENLLGDSIERAYAQGIHELGPLVNYLNQFGPGPQEGDAWTEEAFAALMARLGN
ncbi:hypothetical protein SAMN05216551_105259 [Chitinasiproducens palmae]|uniref:Recombinase-like domain-containing protein n=2 Tax=Chitinasiproducens palmae TaxID=1770053 RepID=A0A1H2PQH6_9BURK|nr:hypothetical protein SAMN05216551_105259 [Chitinasiproducens palmae]